MARDFKRRLARAETAAHALDGVDAQMEDRRSSLRALVAVCNLIRERLLAMSIDPELAVALRRSEEAAVELAGMPDTRERRASEAAVTELDLSEARDRMYIAMTRRAAIMTARFDRGEQPMNLGNASLADLFAFVSAFGPVAQAAGPRPG